MSYIIAFLLFLVAAVLSGVGRAWTMLLVSAGLAVWVWPAALAALR
jgi:hypothetical protein